MHFLFSLLRIKGLYIFRALLGHLQEAINEFHALSLYLLKFILILWFNLCLVLLSSLHPTDYKTKILCVSIMRATCPAHLILLDLITQMKPYWEYKSWSFSLCNFLQPPGTSPLLGPNVFLSTLFYDTHSLLYFFKVRNKIAEKTGKIIISYLKVCFLRKRKFDEHSSTER
jgi:hypothetical protein